MTRRRYSISVRADVYERLRAYCQGVVDAAPDPAAARIAIGPTVERMVTESLDFEEERIARIAELAAAEERGADLQLTLPIVDEGDN